ncbi:MAG: DTW domain-containing protein [Burkholderiaceae bacterium]|nr:DTW domain-containing protein [Burkholderiaceae bacterium]
MSELHASSRPRCERCLRPVSHCLCAHVSRVSNRTHVLILQHPDEHKHPLNTGRLAALGLQRAQLLVGEHFPQLTELLLTYTSAFLLFPGDNAQAPQPLDPGSADDTRLLVVPDGTWRKARQVLAANPLLNTLPRLSLATGAPSTYRVRNTSQAAAVSTIEAIVRTLSALEPEQDFSPVLQPFDVMVEQQIQAMGPEIYRRNYGGQRHVD